MSLPGRLPAPLHHPPQNTGGMRSQSSPALHPVPRHRPSRRAPDSAGRPPPLPFINRPLKNLGGAGKTNRQRARCSVSGHTEREEKYRDAAFSVSLGRLHQNKTSTTPGRAPVPLPASFSACSRRISGVSSLACPSLTCVAVPAPAAACRAPLQVAKPVSPPKKEKKRVCFLSVRRNFFSGSSFLALPLSGSLFFCMRNLRPTQRD